MKAGLSRYDRLAGVTLVQPLNQKNIAFQTCPWADTNGDLNAQNGEIAFDRCTGSLQPSLGFVDPDLKRPVPVGIQRRRCSVSWAAARR